MSPGAPRAQDAGHRSRSGGPESDKNPAPIASWRPHIAHRLFGNRPSGGRGLGAHGGQFALRRNAHRLTRLDKNAVFPLQRNHAHAACFASYEKRSIGRRLNIGYRLLALRYRQHHGVAGAQIHACRSAPRVHHHPAKLQLSGILRFSRE